MDVFSLKCLREVDERVSVAGRVQISTLKSWALEPFVAGGGLAPLGRILLIVLPPNMALVRFVTLSMASGKKPVCSSLIIVPC